MRHSREARHHHAEGLTVGETDTRSLGWAWIMCRGKQLLVLACFVFMNSGGVWSASVTVFVRNLDTLV